jgi:hypothetical protein
LNICRGKGILFFRRNFKFPKKTIGAGYAAKPTNEFFIKGFVQEIARKKMF